MVLALALVSPAPAPLRCTESCIERGDVYACFYELRAVCRRHEIVCEDSVTVECVPTVVSLGTWDPVIIDRPAPYTPEAWPSVGGAYSVTPLLAVP